MSRENNRMDSSTAIAVLFFVFAMGAALIISAWRATAEQPSPTPAPKLPGEESLLVPHGTNA